MRHLALFGSGASDLDRSLVLAEPSGGYRLFKSWFGKTGSFFCYWYNNSIKMVGCQ